MSAPRWMVSYSSGITSWAAAKRIAEEHGTEGMVLVFADTKIEDEDNYRYLQQSAENIGAPLIVIADGRDPWQVMHDERIIGNSRFDPCSKILKRKLLDKWRSDNCTPETTTSIIGLNWDEINRIERARERAFPWPVDAPLSRPPYLSKKDCLAWSEREGITPPRLYRMGFSHANCGGFCIKAGQASFAKLLHHFPERYAQHEKKEQEMRNYLGTENTILREQVNGVQCNLSLRELRERIENKGQIDLFDIGGCGCAL